jgi:2-keto-3-deoxy-L-rhamnonate aldolase RhmA
MSDSTLRNPARERMQNGGVAIGMGLRTTRSVEIAKLAAAAGFDWLFIDLEHNAMSVETAQQIACAALDAGISPLVRVPEGEHGLAARLLDGGALGTVMPHVQNAAEARKIVDLQKYPPMGHRSVSGAMVHFNFRPVPYGEVCRTLNDSCLVVVMLESQEAIAHADEIAAVDGVDVLLVGSGDLSTDMGIPGESGHERLAVAHETVIAACRKHGKWAGCAGIASQDVMAKYIGMGVRFVLAGNDVSYLVQAATARAGYLRNAPLGAPALSS